MCKDPLYYPVQGLAASAEGKWSKVVGTRGKIPSEFMISFLFPCTSVCLYIFLFRFSYCCVWHCLRGCSPQMLCIFDACHQKPIITCMYICHFPSSRSSSTNLFSVRRFVFSLIIKSSVLPHAEAIYFWTMSCLAVAYYCWSDGACQCVHAFCEMACSGLMYRAIVWTSFSHLTTESRVWVLVEGAAIHQLVGYISWSWRDFSHCALFPTLWLGTRVLEILTLFCFE